RIEHRRRAELRVLLQDTSASGQLPDTPRPDIASRLDGYQRGRATYPDRWYVRRMCRRTSLSAQVENITNPFHVQVYSNTFLLAKNAGSAAWHRVMHAAGETVVLGPKATSRVAVTHAWRTIAER